jgi:hypothetical protein
MLPESFWLPEPSFAERLAERRESARRTLREASYDELRALVAELFPDQRHPFAETISRFIEEHHSERAVRGEVPGHTAFVYYPRANRGIWYQHHDDRVSVGLLGETSLKALSEICAEHGRS